MSEKPTPPTDKELAEQAVWAEKLAAVLEEGDQRGWIEYEGYSEPPGARNLMNEYHRRAQDWEAAQRRANEYEQQREREALEKRANAAAEAARQRVLSGK